MYDIATTQLWPKPINSTEFTEAAFQLTQCRKLKHLAALLEMPKKELKALAKAPPQYQAFQIPKSDGGVRLIEAPAESLKKVQQKLNFYLQAYYHGIRPAAAHGGLMAAADDKPIRNILSNARQHLKRQWVLNLDLEDFYHQVPMTKVVDLLKTIIGLSAKIAEKIARLCCFKNRLPMGAPTSCILANYACLELDKRLQNIADTHHLRYTRYIDDLTLSAKKAIPDTLIERIKETITDCRFVINEEKFSLKHLNDTPEVTGLLLLPNKIDIADTYVKELKKDISLYKRMAKAGERITKVFQARTLNLFRQHLQGKINFIGFVRSKADATYKQLKKNMRVVVAVN